MIPPGTRLLEIVCCRSFELANSHEIGTVEVVQSPTFEILEVAAVEELVAPDLKLLEVGPSTSETAAQEVGNHSQTVQIGGWEEAEAL